MNEVFIVIYELFCSWWMEYLFTNFYIRSWFYAHQFLRWFDLSAFPDDTCNNCANMADMPGNSNNSNDLQETIRQCVRDEMRNYQSGSQGVQGLLNRTRSLIRGAVFSAAKELSSNNGLQSETTSSTSESQPSCSSTAPTQPWRGTSLAGQRHSRLPLASVPGHPYRPIRKSTGKKGPKAAKAIQKSISEGIFESHLTYSSIIST